MFGFSMIKVVRQHADKLDLHMRSKLVNLYRPMRKVPCFLHSSIEKWLKKRNKMKVLIEFHEEEAFMLGATQVHELIASHRKCKVHHQFGSIPFCSATLTANAVEDLLTNCTHIKKIHYDREVKALLDKASSSIHADVLNQSGVTGKDITIAIVDTGIYPHSDIKDRIIGFQDFVNQKREAYDDNGHGTHCAGDAAGNGDLSDGKYRGPAPEANLVGVKVLNKMGSGSLSTVIAGVQWCIDNKEEYNIKVISMSLGSSASQPAADDPVVKAVEKAWQDGIVVCVAAGNEGPDDNTVSSPGISSKVITVGAIDDQNTVDRSDDKIASFSSRGPTIDGITKPDILTPGVNIVSLRSPGSYLDKISKDSRVANDYFSLSGTSMATPICAGVAALVLEQNPDFTPDQVKEKLISAAEDWGLPANSQGHGYLNVSKLI
ncbi:serine protease AprX [Fictibacillus solisalsi]|uniref:Serine protease AprX n=1 Tax=Fictibacillus solisalsi TaxID=459525 RepID=A0A1G9YQV7_9BACL|nr:S8 family peptidase [Fictibacillus solisalsi]SDN11387.1 serine protease AprX [Fictibacillus solisalsi]